MSGFLEALVARADGRLPVLERRPRALFEPAAGAATAGFSAHDEDAPARDLAAPHAGRGDAASRRGRDTDPPPAPDDPKHDAAPRPGLLGPIAAPVAMRPVGGEPHELRTARAAVSPVAAEKPAPREPQPVARHVDAPAAARPRAETARTVDASPRAAASTAQAAPQPIGSLQQRAAPLGSAVARLARSSAAMAPRREALPLAAPAPAPVQISIGRVEIRAAHAAAEKPRGVGPASPRLSLDDYLRGRNGAAR